MKKIIVFLLSVIFLLILVGCSRNKPSTSPTNKESMTGSTQSTNDISSGEEKDKVSNCTLIVNGRDITNGNYVKINHQYRNTELPLMAILEELGAKIQWNDTNTVTITFEEFIFSIDTANEDFGLPIPPGTTKAVRQVINNEVLIDGSSVEGLLLNIMGAKMNIDYNASIIYIDTIDK